MAIVTPRKKNLGDRITNFVLVICLTLVVFVCIYPFWHVIMYSLSDSRAAMSGGLFLFPRKFTTSAYEMLFKTQKIFVTFGNSVAKTVVGTGFAMIVTVLTAYALSQEKLRGRKGIQFFIYFTMLFQGGIIPTYIVVRNVGLLDTFWAYIIPALMTPYNMFVLRNFFASIPKDLSESAALEGANPMQILTKIYLPLSKSAIATVTLYYVQSFWNSYMDGVLYINSSKLELFQVYVRKLISQAGAASSLAGAGTDLVGAKMITEETLKMAIISFSVIPVILVYLFLQKYFEKGLTVGAVKG